MGRSRRRSRGAFYGEPNGLQPGDDIGNRRSFKQIQVPPDDIGNRREPDEQIYIPSDDIGNRIDLPPTHEISGVLLEVDGRRRRKKQGVTLVRVGKYFMGGVNPLVSGTEPQRPPEEKREESEPNGIAALDDDGTGTKKRRRRRRRDGREQVDGQAAQEVSERRAQRFFDFEEDDRFAYVLKSDPAEKVRDAETCVREVLERAGRDAVVKARLIEDRDRPKVLITIDERGAKRDLPKERRAENAEEPLFVLGNAALMSLNYLVNKIVNRYPDDRIRLAILPKADEALYLESLEQHIKAREGAKKGEAACAPANGTQNGAAFRARAEKAEAGSNGAATPEEEAALEEGAAEAAPRRTTKKAAAKKTTKKAAAKKSTRAEKSDS